MQFRTEIQVKPSPRQISHSDKVLTMGSCFAENISECLGKAGFSVDTNPFGILYNPASLVQSIQRLIEERSFVKSEVFYAQGLYSTFWHHSRFSKDNLSIFLSEVNDRLKESSRFLREANILILTFGTAYVYHLKDSGQIVSNCHKQPADHFSRQRLTKEKIVSEWNKLLHGLHSINPNLHILFTVSPIRHWKDGAHKNQLNKAILLLAVEEIIQSNQHCFYFPSYELLLDDLRDYRFYADDMLHPSPQAIEYIWSKFSSSFFSADTKDAIREWKCIQRDLDHKPFHPDSEAYKEFRRKAKEKEKSWQQKQK
jgi:GSCFA family.